MVKMNMISRNEKGKSGGCSRPVGDCTLVDGLLVSFLTSCSHKKAWMSRLGKGLYFYAIFETITGCSPNITENIGRLRSKVVTPLKVLQCNQN